MKKNALDGLTTLIHSNWQTLKSSLIQNLQEVENFAHQETQIRKELIEEVDLGPFKQKFDKGLPMRKAAF